MEMKMSKLIIFYLCLSIILEEKAASIIDCNFNMNSYATIGSVYTCEVTNNLNITTPEDAVIEDVSGTHKSGRNNDDVMAFHADNKVIEYFPSGLEKFFKNLKVIRMPGNKIKQVSQFDLKPFPSLVHFEVGSNVIEILEDGLFDNHPNMQVVWFDSNKIFHAGKNVFNNMNKITYLGFGSNSCINMYTQGNATAAQIIIESLKTKCFDATFASFSQKLSNLENQSRTLTFENFQTFIKNLENLENEFKSSKFSNLTTVKRKFQAMHALKESKKCFALNLPNLEGLLSKAEQNLKTSLTSTCSAKDAKFLNLDGKISKIDQSILNVDGKITSNFPQLNEKIINLDRKFVNFDSKFANFDSKFTNLDKKFVTQELAIKSVNQEIVNFGQEFTKLSTNQKEVRNDISKLDENMSTILENSSSEFDKIDKQFLELEDKIAKIEDKFSKSEEKFSNFEEIFEEKIQNLDNKLDRILKHVRPF